MGQGFQFTPVGVRPIIADAGLDASAMHGAAPTAAPAPYDPEAIPDESAPQVLTVAKAPQALGAKAALLMPAAVSTAGAITPRTVIKAARARLKEIKAELRRHEALKKERAQLQRMLTAAGKPSASLTQINSRRVG